MVVGGESGMFWERIEKMCVCWCVYVCVCVQAGYSKWKEGRKFRLRLQGKAPMWPKLPEKACTAAQLCSKQEGSRSGQQTRGASPKANMS